MSAGSAVVFAALAALVCCSPREAPVGAPEPSAAGSPSGVIPAESTRPPDRVAGSALLSASDVTPAPGLPPLSTPTELVDLEVEGHRAAVVSVPLGATEPRPVVMALHGNFDRPEWQCEVWRRITGAFAFVLCPRGIPRDDAPGEDRWTWSWQQKTEAEIDRAVEALKKRFEGYVADGPMVFTAFSLGAIQGARIVAAHPERWPRVVFVEGGYETWSSARANTFKKGGGERILLGCAQSLCKNAAVYQLAPLFQRAGVGFDYAYPGHVGHTYDGVVAEGVTAKWPWLVDGAAGFPATLPMTGPSTAVQLPSVPAQ